jgi:hypothetical protein
METIIDNPAILMAKKALTPEQQEEYKKMGEYMYNTEVYKTIETGSKIKDPETKDILAYAVEGLKSGLNPFDLSEKELRAIIEIYGDFWYIKFGYEENEVPKLNIQVVNGSAPVNTPMTRKERREYERKREKMLKRRK